MHNLSYRWVNYQGLLEACLVGKLVDGPEPPTVIVKPLPPPPGDSPRNTHSTNNQKASPNTVSVKQKFPACPLDLVQARLQTAKCCL